MIGCAAYNLRWLFFKLRQTLELPIRGTVRNSAGAVGLIIFACLLPLGATYADGSGDPAAVSNKDGRYLDKDGNPTYKVQSDGTVDWYTYSGFRRTTQSVTSVMGPTARDRPMLQHLRTR